MSKNAPGPLTASPPSLWAWGWYWGPVVGYAGLMIWFSSLSSPEAHLPRLFLGISDKIAHGLEYAGLSLLLYRALRFVAPGQSVGRLGATAILLTIFFGLTDEIHQYFVPRRFTDFWDLVADAAGAAVGVLTARVVLERSKPSPDDAWR